MPGQDPAPRPSWDQYFRDIAEAVARRADCTRRKVGAVIVDTDHRIISTGYNGAKPDALGCLSGGCPRGKHFQRCGPERLLELTCQCGLLWPCPHAVEPGSSYDTGPGTCIALHAEQNALLYAFRSVRGMTMYVTDEPCGGCMKLIEGAQIGRVKTPLSDLDWRNLYV